MAQQTFTAGQVLTAAQMDTLQANSGLQLIQAETTISSASSVTANNVFTSTFTNYKVVLVYNTSTTNSVGLRLRVGGVSAATNYNFQNFASTGATNTGSNSTGQTSIEVGPNSDGVRRCYSVIDISGPALAGQTTFQTNVSRFAGSNSGLVQLLYGMHDQATAYDGFELLVSSGTFSGSYTIYGYGKTA